MSLQRIEWDEWDGPRNNEHGMDNPAWEDVQSVIGMLNADRHTLACLIAPNGNCLLIGGGQNHFIMTIGVGDDDHLTALDESKQKEEFELTVGGQTSNYDSRMIWDIETALKSAYQFWCDNTVMQSLIWK